MFLPIKRANECEKLTHILPNLCPSRMWQDFKDKGEYFSDSGHPTSFKLNLENTIDILFAKKVNLDFNLHWQKSRPCC